MTSGGVLGRHQATLTIKADGTWENVVPTLPPGRFLGTAAVSGGVMRWRSVTTGMTGTYRLHEGGGRRMLKLVNDSGAADGTFVPAR